LLYGANSPYARTAGSGDARAVAGLTRADLIAFQQAWLRPDKAKLFVVSDRPLAEVQAALEPVFGDWKASGTAGVKRFEGAGTPAAPKIVLIDRPDSPQSVIVAGIPNALTGTEDLLPIQTANDALGGGFLGRLNMDLREGKHWSYGVYGIFRQLEHAAPFYVQAPVQADKTGPSIAALRGDLSGFVGAEPMTQVEFDRAISGAVRSLSGNFETGGAVLGAMQNNDLYRRPDDYYATIAQRYRGMTLPQLNTAMKAALDPSRAIWVVIGDAKVVRPQLDTLGLPVESVTAASVTGAKQETK
jgi:predicted Zn-dependent peptidase